MAMTAKITSKGQVTIPRKIREHLKTNTVEFDLVNGNILIRPVSSVGGSLKSYAKDQRPMKEVRDRVWKEVADAKATG